jgi:GntR family transcriptional regulator, transcriptional repressor for pyruvate dehydrogenase complex
MSERQPKSTMVRTGLEHDLYHGNFRGKLPSMEELADRYGASRVTVRNVLLQLQQEGVLTIRQGSGTYIKKVNLTTPSTEGTNMLFPYSQAVTRYREFLINPRIPSNIKNRMVGIVDSQMTLTMEARQVIY